VEEFADKVSIIRHGQIVQSGTLISRCVT